MLTLAQFQAQRKTYETQYFPASPGGPPAPRTIMVSSHIWWTELLAYAILNSGCNLLLYHPLYYLYTNPLGRDHFDLFWNKTLQDIRSYKVDLLLAGNTTALVPHPKTHELLHRAAGIPVVHYWWDEPRAKPPFAETLPSLTPDDYLAFLRDERTLNVFWDIDVLEEMRTFFNIHNSFHLPLATEPDLWPDLRLPLAQRPLDACFLGNCHFSANYVDTQSDPLLTWANAVIAHKQAHLDSPMIESLASVGPAPLVSSLYDSALTHDWTHRFRPWEILNAVWMHRSRNLMVQTAAHHLHGRLALIGKGWDAVGLRANSEHARENTGKIYALSKASLNLFGGCVHAGMPLRPFDIAASHGLIVTHYQRELPSLFEPGQECVAFRTPDEMLQQLDDILCNPAAYDAIATAGKQRTLRQHTWHHRVQKILTAAAERFPP